MRIVAISDTHGLHEQVDIPDGDVLIHAGDLTMHGTIENFIEFDKWFAQFPHKYKIIVAGNHDTIIYNSPELVSQYITSAYWLQDVWVLLDGIRFYGSAWTPEFMSWSFTLPRDGKELRGKWELIHAQTDVLITHGPPFGIMDKAKDFNGTLVNAGCKLLRERISHLNLRAHIFGHIHGGYGKDGIFHNVSICNESYEPANKATVIDL